jgi:dTDP-4-dehydrorhamnose reductase
MRLYPWHGSCKTLESNGRKLLVTGATGTLGRAFAERCEHRGLPFCLSGRDELDVTDPRSIAEAIARHEPWAVINAAGFVRPADAEHDSEACFAANSLGAEQLARACAERGLPLVAFSSDLVFDGRPGALRVESDAPFAASVYGRSKAEAEQRLREAWERALIVRTSAFFGPWDQANFAWRVLAALRRGEPVRASRSGLVSPTYVPDLCTAVLDLLIDGETGIWHLANQYALSWHDFAARIAAGAGYDPAMVLPIGEPAANSPLASERGMLLPPLDQAIERFLDEVGEHADAPRYAGIAAE